uniref:BZIP domain-containing protein n=1 Tax=Salix viminalis TaxID=40686 RepID=A0A6N2LAJ4_SALVM
MGTGEESTPAKPSKPASSNQEIPTTPSYPDWSSSMQAYYGAGATPPPFFASTVASPTPHPYIWGSQHPLIPPYGTPVPYPALYPAGGVYAHPNMAPIPNSTQVNIEMEGKVPDGKDRASAKKAKGASGGKAGESGKAASGSGIDGASQSADSGSDGSSDASDENTNQQEYGASKKGSFNQMLADANAQSTSSGANIQASVPGKPVVSMPATNLNIGMDLWNASSAAGATKMRPNPSGATSGVAPAGMPEQWIHDERELKRQKRKQSNRESARRSRLRKQAECEELQVRVESLSNDNSNLRDELQSLSGECNKLKSENDSIKEELTRLYGPEAVDKLEQCNPASVLQGAVDSKTETS